MATHMKMTNRRIRLLASERASEPRSRRERRRRRREEEEKDEEGVTKEELTLLVMGHFDR
jgi:hypothetical protein